MTFTIIRNCLAAFLVIPLIACKDLNSPSEAMKGYWKSEGYGWVMEVQDDDLNLYDSLNGECVKTDIFELFTEIDAILTGLTLENNVLISSINGIKNPPIRWTRQRSFEQACPEGAVARVDEEDYVEDVIRDYDWYVKTYKRHYAFSELRGINNAERFAEGRALLEADPTKETLLAVLDGFISETQDGHVNLLAINRLTNEAVEENAEAKIEVENLSDGDIAASIEGALAIEGYKKGEEDLESYVGEQLSIILESIRNQLDMELRKSDEGEIINWIPVKGHNQGYILLLGMEQFGGESLTLEEQEQALDIALDDIMLDFKNMDRIIIDNRLNGGGFDHLGFKIAQRFMSKEASILNKTLHIDGEWKDLGAIEIKAHENNFSGDVILLNSPYTASAAETFSMVLAEQANVRVLGEATAGELSDMLFKTLPNGLLFTLSNEAYRNEAGELYEFVGVPVDIESKSFSENDRATGQDKTLALGIDLP